MSAQPLEARLAHVEGAFLQVDRRLDSLERRLESLERAIESRFNWLVGIFVASWISTIVTVLFHR
ncbi:MAG TPA: hypothetical protein VIW73_05365 [Candidatus Cybelea sp.]